MQDSEVESLERRKGADHESPLVDDGVVGGQGAGRKRPPERPDLRLDHRLGRCGNHRGGQVQEPFVLQDAVEELLGGHGRRGGGDREDPLRPFPSAGECLGDNLLKHWLERGAGERSLGAAEGEPDQRATDRA
jgi:hypothetical protein